METKQSAEAILMSDLEIIWEHLERDDSQFWRRSYCRTLMALFEATIAYFASNTLEYYDGVLGEAEKRSLRRRFGALTRAFDAFDLFTNVAGVSTPFARGSEEWLVLEKAIRIRNRVTHPTCAGDLEISDLDMAHLRITSDVVFRLTIQAQRYVSRALLRKAQQIRKVWKERAVPSVLKDAVTPARLKLRLNSRNAKR